MNPLPFDALEPKRFEDLVRQLAYDFRQWRKLEATGRSGSDDGFDARGWEIAGASSSSRGDDEPEDEPGIDPAPGTDRLWLIQCKREAAIGPTKLVGYLNAIGKSELPGLHGIILSAPANFSKAARDQFIDWCRSNGISEAHLWGRGELEDALFQPKNDNLLFAYFGISLQIRKRSRQTELRARTTIKRKLKRAIENAHSVLFRDAEDIEYPWHSRGRSDHRWWVYTSPRLTFRGLEVVKIRYFAFVDEDGEHWDYANVIDDMTASPQDDPWRGERKSHPRRGELLQFWQDLPDGQRAMLTVNCVIELDSILEVDEIGDDFTTLPRPHVFVNLKDGSTEPYAYLMGHLQPDNRWAGQTIENPDPDMRIERFPAEFRRPVPTAKADAAENAADLAAHEEAKGAALELDSEAP